mmetsp:Transcript_29395/g.75788  ORF Transcript_29395/g.75788 Transcript_29395/m.75788 type:complete len:170 (+) Transcript_29395:759-1268(+)
MIIPLSGDRRDFRQCIGTASNPGKEASTEIKVVQRGQLFGENVTLVHLYPKTGRRHQLRLHLADLGFPIVGDSTYTDLTFARLEKQSNDEEDGAVDSLFKRVALLCEKSDRMCLHALELHLPCKKPFGERSFTTEDPFVSLISRKREERDEVEKTGKSEVESKKRLIES